MTNDDPLRLWRNAQHLTVEDAAILIAGGDPSEVDEVDGAYWDRPGQEVKRTTKHPGFVAALATLKPAVIRGHIPSDSDVSELADWARVWISVEDLKMWLKKRGHTTGFFFPTIPDVQEDFADQSHQHFSPELVLAVAAWRALARTEKFVRGPKAAIENWIEANPREWQGKEELSGSARERIAMLVNWKPKGGAPTSGG